MSDLIMRVKRNSAGAPDFSTAVEVKGGDLIRRQDAFDAVRKYLEDSYIEDAGWHMNEIEYRINALPSADAVEVVRCKDCKHRRGICSMRYIEMVGEDERIYDYSTDNGYCSWGERREDGEA